MKMKKSLVALCLTAGLFASVPGISGGSELCTAKYQRRARYSCCCATAINPTPVDQSKTQSTQLATGGQRLDVAGITGPVAAYSVPANIGELTLTLTSEVNKQASVFAPNVLILDQNMTPSAFFPSSYFYLSAAGRHERRPAGRRDAPDACVGAAETLCSGVYDRKDLQQTTTLLDPAKAYAKGVGNSIPDIPDPVARHTTDGVVKLKVKTNSSSSVLVGPLFGSSGTGPVTVGNTAAPVAAPAPVAPKKSEPMLNDTESYFNKAIKDAVAKGDVDKALKLLDEAERLGSTSARSTFISSVKGKG